MGPFTGNKLSAAIIIATNNPVNQQWTIPEKKQGVRGGVRVVSHLRIYFSEKEPGNLTFATLGTFRNSRESRLNYENSTKLCDDTASCGNLKVKS